MYFGLVQREKHQSTIKDQTASCFSTLQSRTVLLVLSVSRPKKMSATCTRINEIHMNSIVDEHETFLFDCDGVIWSSPMVLPGAIELLNYLTNRVSSHFQSLKCPTTNERSDLFVVPSGKTSFLRDQQFIENATRLCAMAQRDRLSGGTGKIDAPFVLTFVETFCRRNKLSVRLGSQVSTWNRFTSSVIVTASEWNRWSKSCLAKDFTLLTASGFIVRDNVTFRSNCFSAFSRIRSTKRPTGSTRARFTSTKMFVFNGNKSTRCEFLFFVKINCVISAFDVHVNYRKIIKAATYLNRPNVLFLATNDDVTTPQNDVAILPGLSLRHTRKKLFDRKGNR